VLLLVLGGGAAGLWWTWQRAEQARAVNADLEEAVGRLRAWEVREAEAALLRAEGRVAGGGPAGLRRRVQQLREDLTLVRQLEQIRLKKATIADGKLDYASADRDYATLFQRRGLAEEREDSAVVAARIQGSVIWAQLVAALDDWAVATDKPARRAWLLDVARRADPGEWSDRFRDVALWEKKAALEHLAREAKIAELTPQLLTALGLALWGSGGDAVPLFKAAQAHHPGDFWLNFLLGNVLRNAKPEEAIAYYRAALALRPDTSAVYNNLGNALQAKGQLEEAIQHYRRAIELDPKNALAHTNLGPALYAKGKVEEAMQHYRQAIALDPKFTLPHNNLGNVLYRKGQVEEAIKHFRQAIALDSKDAKAHYNLGVALEAKGKVKEATQHYRQAITLEPKHAQAHTNLGAVLQAKGQVEEAIRHYCKAIDLDPNLALAHTNLGLALYDKGQVEEAIQHHRQALALDPKNAKTHYNLGLALGSKGQVDQAMQHFRRAVALDPKHALAHNNLGNALAAKGQVDEAIRHFRQAIAVEPKNATVHTNLGAALAAKGQVEEAIQHYRQAIELEPKYATAHYNLGIALDAKGQLEEAIKEYRQAIELEPKYATAHGALGQALLQQGQFAHARDATRRCLDLLPPDHPQREFGTQQLRSCERWLALEENLPAILQGKRKPADATEQIGLAQLCQRLKQLYAASARFYTEAFTEQPGLAQDLRAGHRYHAACAASLAASGHGKDAENLTDKDRASLREQALHWLRADLAAWTKVVDQGAPQPRPVVQQTLQHWQKDPALTGLRDQAALAKLPEAERQAWGQLWTDVAALLRRVQEKK
jgi:tetratricopeptide (TPR) repeat protein